MVLRADPVLRGDQRDLFLIGVGIDVALVQAALDVIALGLFGKHHGKPPTAGADGGKRDAAGLRRQDQVDLRQIEALREGVRDVLHQFAVDAMVQKTVHLDDVARQHLTLAPDTFFQFLHSYLQKIIKKATLSLCCPIPLRRKRRIPR